MHPFIKFGLSLVGVVCLMAGPAWAQDDGSGSTITVLTSDRGRASYVSEWNPDSPVTSFRGTSTGANTSFGAYTCSFAGTNTYLGPAAELPLDTNLCDTDSSAFPSYGSYNYSYAECRLEDTGEIFTFDIPGTAVACVPLDCFEGPLTTEAGTEFYLLKGGCGYSTDYTLTTTLEGGGTGTHDFFEYLQVDQSEYDASRGVVVTRLSSNMRGRGTVTIPEDELPANDVSIEVPAPGSTMSGIGLISGWSCLSGDMYVYIDHEKGDWFETPLARGNERRDTESVCGDSNNGFSATVNWSLIGPGPKTISIQQNGLTVASHDFSVVSLGTEFLSGASGMCSISDFPTAGESATLEWDESQQGFVVTQIN